MRTPATILITGASSGIGAALALYYAADGRSLYLQGRDSVRLERVASHCRTLGAEVETRVVDVRNRESMALWISEADQLTPLDLVIASAGISAGTGGHGESDQQCRDIFAVNVDGVLNTVHPVMERMRKRGKGQIGIMASIAGFRGLPTSPAYSASKAAVKVYGEALRGDLGNHGVQVSVICPGYIRTPMTDVNDFTMPLLMEPDKAARIIARGLARNKSRIAFPFPMYLAIWLATLLPPFLTDPIFARLPRKPSVETKD